MMFPWDPSEAEAADVESELLGYNLEPHFTETIADAEIDFATCVDRKGRKYNIELDSIRGFEDDFEK